MTSDVITYKDPRESNLTTSQNIRISHIVKFSGIKNTLNFNYSNSGRNDRVDDRNEGYQFNKTATSTYTFGVNTTYPFPLRTSINVTSNTSKSSMLVDPYELFMISLRGRYDFFDGRLITELGYTNSVGSGMVDFTKNVIFTGGTFTMFQRHQLRWRIQDSNYNNRLRGEVFNDISFLLNYTILL